MYQYVDMKTFIYGNSQELNFRLSKLPYKTLGRRNSYFDHLVRPTDDSKHNELPVLLNTKSKFFKKDSDIDSIPAFWDNIGDHDDLLFKNRPSTIPATYKTNNSSVKTSNRAKTSDPNFKKNSPSNSQRPITSLRATGTPRQRLIASSQRKSTPTQKVRISARCFLSAFTDPNFQNECLDVALGTLIGKKKPYVI